MEKNVCGLDRKLRLAAGVGLLTYALTPQGDELPGTVSTRRILAGYAAAEFLLINWALQWCPLNYALGVNTCEADWPTQLRWLLGGGRSRTESGEAWVEVPVE